MIRSGTRVLVRHGGPATVVEGPQDAWSVRVLLDFAATPSDVQRAYLVPEDPAADPFFEEP